MKIYEYNDYRDIINAFMSEQKILDNKLTYQQISLELRLQKSYFSKIMAGAATLTKDQAYLLAKFMEMSEEEKDFLYLLVDYDRVGIKEHKQSLLEKIKTIQIKNTQSDKYLEKENPTLSSTEMQEYYLLPEIQLIHLACSLGLSIEEIKNKLRLSDETFKASLKILEKLNLVKIENKELVLIKSNLHLDHSSPFFHQWQTQFKLKGLEWIKDLELKDKYNFLASFTASEDDKEKIRVEFLNFLKKVEKIVKNSDSQNLYQLNFDLFKWI